MAEMASLYRRYRPQTFAEVRGQEFVVTALRNAVRDQKVAHAYLFSGPRGTGKTSTARILAKALNCTDKTAEGDCCGVCGSCTSIRDGSSLDVTELDAASNNGVEAVRDLIGKTGIGSPGEVKVYVIDEVHMLSTAASNALLKTLEEPPSHVAFVLATTDPQKVLATIKSRTQHFEFRLISPEVLDQLVVDVAGKAGISLDAGAMASVVRQGKGSARDTLSVLEQVAAAGGIRDEVAVAEPVLDALAARDVPAVLAAVAGGLAAGRDPRRLATEVLERLRWCFLAAFSPDLADVPDHDKPSLVTQATALGPAAMTRAMEVLGEALVDLRESVDPRITLEVALVRLARPGLDKAPASLVERLERLEMAFAEGGSRPAPAPPPTPAPAPPPAAADAPAHVPARPAPAAPAPPPPTRTEPAAPAGGGSGLAGARAALAARNDAASGRPSPAAAPSPRAALGAFRSPRPEASGTPPAPAAEPTAEPAAAPAPVPTAAPAPAGSFDHASLVACWNDVLPTLKGSVKSRFGSGRFTAFSDGTATFAVDNEFLRADCDAKRTEVEAALAAAAGRPIAVRVVTDAQETVGGVSGGAPLLAADDDVDLSMLVDAPDVPAPNAHAAVLGAFPGAEEVPQ